MSDTNTATENVEYLQDAEEVVDPHQAVTQHLDAAVREAEATNMGTSELMGLFFFYAQSLAADARERLLQDLEGEEN